MPSMEYETVLKRKYPAKMHAVRVMDYIRKKAPNATGALYLEGTKERLIEDLDQAAHFRQRRHFYYLTGVNIPDCHFVYDIASAKSILFVPPVDPEAVLWAGLPMTPEEALRAFDVDEVKYSNEVNATLTHIASTASTAAAGSSSGAKSTVFAMADRVSDEITFLEFDDKNLSLLREAIELCRVVKDDYEIAMLTKANVISSEAHHAVLQNVSTAQNEQELEALFVGKCGADGAKEQSYHTIAAAGRAGSYLHYVDNDKPLTGKLNVLLDAGSEWKNYCADITRTFPINGTFSKESRAIYDIVLKMQLECIGKLKGGVLWDDVHIHAHKVAIDGLLELGILKGDKDKILAARTTAAFFPHGLGHYLGMDTHDCGGFPNYEDKDIMFRYLRVRREVPEGAVITVEPGIYFCEFIIAPFLKDPKHSQYIDANVLDQYWDVGGVRIEDNVVVTKDGVVNLTLAEKDPEKLQELIRKGLGEP